MVLSIFCSDHREVLQASQLIVYMRMSSFSDFVCKGWYHFFCLKLTIIKLSNLEWIFMPSSYRKYVGCVGKEQTRQRREKGVTSA